MGIEEVVIAFRSPRQSLFVERLISSIRRECLGRVVVRNQAHLMRLLTSCFEDYHLSRTYLSLGRNAPVPCRVEDLAEGKVIVIPQVGGLHHRYVRAAWALAPTGPLLRLATCDASYRALGLNGPGMPTRD